MKKGLLSALLLLVNVVAFGQTLKNQTWTDTNEVAGDQVANSVTELSGYYFAVGQDLAGGLTALDSVNVDSMVANNALLNYDLSASIDGGYFVDTNNAGTKLYVAGLLDTTTVDTTALYFSVIDPDGTLDATDTLNLDSLDVVSFGGAAVTSDDGLVAVVNVLDASGNIRMVVAKFASTGGVVWVLVDSLDNGIIEEGHAIFEAPSGKFIVAGTIDTTAGGDNVDAFMAEIAADGSTYNFFKTYGATDASESFEAASALSGGGFGFAGGISPDAGDDEMYLKTTATNGDGGFSQTIDVGTNSEDWAYGFSEQADGRFVLVGKSDNLGAMHIANSLGASVFSKTFGYGTKTCLADVLQTSDGGLLSVGYDIDAMDSNFFYAYYQFLDITVDSSYNPTCADTANGEAYFGVSGGQYPYVFDFYRIGGDTLYGITSIDTTELIAGSYKVVVTDADLQKDSVSFVLMDPTAITIDSYTDTNNTCYGEADGSIIVHASGGSGDFQYAVNGGIFQADSLFAGLSDTIYWFSVMDYLNGCIIDSISSHDLAGPDSLYLFTDSVRDGACSGDNSGYIALLISGGVGNDTIYWDSTSTGTFVVADSAQFVNLGAGTYRFTVIDSNGCNFDTLNVVVGEPDVLSISIATSTDADCFESEDGFVITTTIGGTAPYSYLWRNNTIGDTLVGADSSSIVGVGAATYEVFVTDSNGCVDSVTTIVGAPGALVILQDSLFNVSCYGDSMARTYFSFSGGTPLVIGYSVSIVDTISGDTLAMHADTMELSYTNLYSGVFFVNVEDDNGCMAQDTFAITQPDILGFTLLDSNVTCVGEANGVIRPTVFGGTQPYTFAWTDTSGIFTSSDSIIDGLMGGRYILTLTDANGCVAIDSAGVSAADTLGVSAVVTDLVGCTGGTNGSIDVTVTGGAPGVSGYTFAWTGPDGFTDNTEDIDSLVAGSYTLTVMDSIGCDSTIMFNVIDGSTAITSLDTITNVSCFGGSDGQVSIMLAGGNPGYTYDWSNGSTDSTLAGVGAGNYTLVVTDQVGCLSDTLFVTVTEPSVLAISSLGYTPNDCFGGSTASISMTVVGGTPYTVGDAYSYSWTSFSGAPVTDSLSPNNLNADIFYVVVTDTLGCTALDTIVGVDPVVISNTVDTTINITCAGDSTGSILVNTTGGTPAVVGYTFAWLNNSGDTVSTEENLVGMPAGTYFLAITDSLLCFVIDTLTIGQNTPTNAVSTIDSVSCYGANDGVIAAIATGGVPYTIGEPYLYTWLSGIDTISDSASAVELYVGTYYLTVTDSLGCTFLDTIVVPGPAQITFTAVVSSLTNVCYNASTGAIDVTVLGGVPAVTGYVYSWTDSISFTSSSEDLTGLYRGTYYLSVQDSLGCVVDTFFVVGHPDFWSNTSSDLTDVACNGDSTGSVVNTIAGGTSPYTYAWWVAGAPGDTIATSYSIAGLSAGTYKFAVEDFVGCDTTFTFVIAEPNLLMVSLDSTVVNCFGDTTGSITTAITGGTADYSSVWSGPSGYAATVTTANYTLSNLAAGMYYVTITDDTSCVLMDSIMVEQPDTALYLTKVVNPIVSCYGSSTGSVDVTPLGGALNYTFSWTGPNAFTAATEDISGLVAGLYILALSDTNGCIFIDTSYVINAVDPVAVAIGGTVNVLCNGDSTGSAKAIVTGGTGDYTYYWENASGDTVSFDSLLVGMPAGDYTLFVEDSLGCDGVPYPALLTITEPVALGLSAVVDSVKCKGESNGSILLTVTGGVLPYTYDWNSGNSFGQDTLNLDSAAYTVIVTDANGCSITDTYNVYEPALLDITSVSVDSVSCNGASDGAIAITVAGGTSAYSFLWSNGQTTQNVSGLTAGLYSLMVTDANGCQDSISVMVYEPAALAMTVVNSPVTCNGGTDGALDISITGGIVTYSYSWTGDATTNAEDLTGLSAGSYTITVTDANGCTLDSTIEVVEPPLLTVTVDSTHMVSCKGGSDGAIFITAAGGNAGYTYSWSDLSTAEDRTGLSEGSYIIIVTDAKGCQDSVTVTVTEPAAALAVTETHIDVACYGDATGSVNITVTGGTSAYTYAWSNGSTDEDATGLLGDSTYTVVVTDANGCNYILSVSLTQPTELLAPISKLDVFPCYDGRTGNASVSPVGGVAPYQVIWSNMPLDTILVNSAGTHLNDSLFAGTYGVTVIDANGCISVNAVILLQPTEVEATATVVSNINCLGNANGSASVSVTGGTTPYEYNWMHNGANTSSINGLSAGTYTVIVNDFYGCSDQVSVTITAPAELIATVVGTDVSCFGNANGSAVLTVQGGTTPYTYNWGSFGTTKDLSGLNPGTYSVIVTDGNGCAANTAVTIGQPVSAIVLSATSINVNCNGQSNGSINVTANGGVTPYSYVWSNGGNTAGLSNISAGTYSVTVTDANGCSESLSLTISQPGALTATIAKTNVQCSGANNGSLDLILNGGTPPFTYSWSNGAVSRDVSGLNAGPYLVTVTDANGCSVTASATITAPQAISTSVVIVNVTCNGGVDGRIDQTVTGGTAPYTYAWNNGATFEDLTLLSAGTYTVVISDANGCSVTGTYNVAQFEPLQVTVLTTDVECSGETDGTAFALVTGGSGSYSFIWNTGAADQFITNLGDGNYTVTVTDQVGCSVSATETVASPAPLVLSIDKTDETAVDACNGEADLTVTGGTAPFIYAWTNGKTIEDITALCPGAYAVTVTDANGCQASISIAISTFVGLEEVEAISEVKVYPNPTTGLAFVEFNATQEMDVTVVVTDMTGAFMMAKEVKTTFGNFKMEIDMNNYARGIYLVNVKSVEGMITKRIAVQ